MPAHPLTPFHTLPARVAALPRRRLLMTGLGLVLSAAGWSAAPARAADGRQAPVITVGERAVGEGLVLDGSLQAVHQSVLSAQASGRIANLTVKAGDRVKAGQVLAVIDDRATRAGVAQAQAGVAQAEANLAHARAA